MCRKCEGTSDVKIRYMRSYSAIKRSKRTFEEKNGPDAMKVNIQSVMFLVLFLIV